jgi:O-antigen/teichoic acid export membrane protein
MLIFLVPFSLALVQTAVIPLLYGISKHQFYVYSNLVEGVINLALSIILAHYYGLYGVALGTAIPMTIKLLFIQPWYACRVIGLTTREYAWLLGRNIFIASVGISLGKLVLPHIEQLGLIGFCVAGVVHFALFVPVALYFGFEPRDRERLITTILSSLRLKKIVTA